VIGPQELKITSGETRTQGGTQGVTGTQESPVSKVRPELPELPDF